MSSDTTSPIAPRRPQGADYTLSELTLHVGPVLGGPPGAAALAAPWLRRARSLGVTTFDLSDAAFPSLAEERFAEVFPEPDPALTIVLPVASLAPPAGPEGRRSTVSSASTDLGQALRRSRARLGPPRRLIVEWSSDGDQASGRGSPPSALRALRDAGELLDIAVRLSRSVESIPPGAGLCSGPLSLLDSRLVRVVANSPSPETISMLARDVFAGGALDGSIWSGPRPGVGGVAPPPTVAQLHERLDPVLALAPLALPRQRTLAQAALGFVLRWPWVASAVVPLPPPERFGAILESGRGPALTEEEVAGVVSGARRPVGGDR